MKKLSRWAKENPWKARIIIILVHFALVTIALFTGESFTTLGIQFPAWLLFLFLSVFILAAVFYPSRRKRTVINRDLHYFRQKSCDFLLAASTFCMILCLATKNTVSVSIFQPASASNGINLTKETKKPTAEEILASLAYRDKSTLTRAEKRILKQEFKTQLKNYVAAKLAGNKAEGDRVGLIILAIIGALGLLFLLASLSCSIACGGSEGLAIAFLIVGAAGIIWGLIAVIRNIKRNNKKARKE